MVPALWEGLGTTTERERFIRLLESVADRAGIMPAAETSALLRRAALRLRNTTGLVLDPDVDDALSSLASDMGMPKPDLIWRALREWLAGIACLPVHDLDEDGERDGSIDERVGSVDSAALSYRRRLLPKPNGVFSLRLTSMI
jgi:hypothetical protein